MSLIRHETHLESGTVSVACDFASHLRSGDVVLLHGDLGAGKSVFVRGCIRTLCRDEALVVPSPTFTLVQVYDQEEVQIWHFDLYRLGSPDEIYEIGWEEAICGGIVFVEWPERLGHLRPRNAIDITLRAGHDEEQRIIEIQR